MFYPHIPHKIKEGDITNLSNKDSESLVKIKKPEIEDIIEVESQGVIYLGQITYIFKDNIEIQILSKTNKSLQQIKGHSLTIIQSVSTEKKITIVIEKAIELGVNSIIPVHSEYSKISLKRARKQYSQWIKIVKNAKEQSRNFNEFILDRPKELLEIETFFNNNIQNQIRICLSTEFIKQSKFSSILRPDRDIVVAIGPEKGWSLDEIDFFKKNNFIFCSIGKYILRTETASIVVASIYNFLNNQY